MQHELRMKQLKNETERIRNETEQLELENARLESLISCVNQLCFPPESSSTPPQPTEPDCRPS